MNVDCLSPITIDLFVGGQLPEGDLLRLERHLDVCAACMDLVGTLAASRRDANDSASSTAAALAPMGIGRAFAAMLSPGTSLGRYEVRRWLGRGGMGDVYEGFDRHLERRVALKLLRDASGDADLARLRLGREAKNPSILPSGDILFARRIGDGVALRLYRRGASRIETVTDGPVDWAPSALPNGDFLVLSRPDAAKAPTIVRCPKAFRGSTTSYTPVARLAQPVQFGPASPDGRWVPYVVPDAGGPMLRVLSLEDPTETRELAQNASICQLIWSGPRTLWASLRVGDTYRWVELDVVANKATGRSALGTACTTGEPDPNPPLRPAAWTVVNHEYQLRLMPHP